MHDAFAFVVSSLCDLCVVTFFLRLAMAWVRADFRNPLAQFVVKATNPLVVPARRFIPAIGGIDTATLVVLLLIQTLATGILVKLSCMDGGTVPQIAMLAVVRLAHLVLNLYFWLIAIYVLSSWFAPGGYNPALAMLATLVRPILAPFQRVIPAIGGFDLSPVAVMLALGFAERLLPSGTQWAGLICMQF